MATEKYFVFSESGELKRMKGRIVRFLDNEDPTGSDKDAIRTSLEVSPDAAGLVQADIGTQPNEIPVNGMLGDMAYQSSAGVAMVNAEVETLEVTDKVTGPLTVSNTSAATSFILANSGGGTTLNFAVTENTGGIIDASEGASARNILFKTGGAERWRINSSGNLVANGTAIDFGAVATSAGDGTGTTGTPANSVLSDYEFGSWVPRFEMTGSNFAALTMDVIAAHYCKVGRHVFCQANIMTDNVDTTGATGTVAVQGLPFVSETTTYSGNLSVGYSSLWVNAPTAGYVHPNASYASLTRIGTTGITAISASDMTNGASSNVNQLIFTVSYIAST